MEDEIDALISAGHSHTEIAKILGISSRSLSRKKQEYQLSSSKFLMIK